MNLHRLNSSAVFYHADNREALAEMPDNCIDAVVTDPPYALVSIGRRFGAEDAAPAKSDGPTGVYARASAGFMGKTWDNGRVAFAPEFWSEILRVLKPGGHVVAFGGSRTYHRIAVAIEDAGFEIRDSLMWVYGTGFPKSHNTSKAIDKVLGIDISVVESPATPEAEQWEGWGTALKPAFEPIALARKPLSEKSVAANVLRWGTGALNIDGCRIGDEVRTAAYTSFAPCHGNALGAAGTAELRRGTQKAPKEYVGRWPANVLHDGSDEVVEAFPDSRGQQGDVRGSEPSDSTQDIYGKFGNNRPPAPKRNDAGSAARFFYSAKASKADRAGSKHPTVKPVALMSWLCRLVTPPGGVVLDPFAGSGTTGAAAAENGFACVMCESEDEYAADIRRRCGPTVERVGALFGVG